MKKRRLFYTDHLFIELPSFCDINPSRRIKDGYRDKRFWPYHRALIWTIRSLQHASNCPSLFSHLALIVLMFCVASASHWAPRSHGDGGGSTSASREHHMAHWHVCFGGMDHHSQQMLPATTCRRNPHNCLHMWIFLCGTPHLSLSLACSLRCFTQPCLICMFYVCVYFVLI